MGWGVGLSRGTGKPLTGFFFFVLFFCWGERYYHADLSTGWAHKLSWAPPVFMTGEEATEGRTWHCIITNNITWQCFTLTLFSSPSHCLRPICLTLFFTLLSWFSTRSGLIRIVLAHCFMARCPPCPPLSLSLSLSLIDLHTWGGR